MDRKLILIPLLVLFLISFSFAAVTVSEVTISPSYTADRNYFSQPITISATAAGDVNATDTVCWYEITTNGSKNYADWNGDTLTCSVSGYSSAGNDDFNFSIIVSNDVGDANGTSNPAFYWKDNNAPTISSTNEGSNFSTKYYLTCTDTATNTGLGSGCASITYSIDGGDTNTTVAGSTATINLNTVGTKTIRYSTTDNLGNVRYYTALPAITIQAYASGVCSLANLITLVLIGALIVTILIAGFSLFNGGEISSTVVALVATAIFMLIMTIIIATFTGAVCIAPL